MKSMKAVWRLESCGKLKGYDDDDDDDDDDYDMIGLDMIWILMIF